MKKSFIFTFIMIILGAIIGAGFASGKEIVSFFGQYGYLAIPLLLLVAAIFFFFFYIFSKLGKMIRPQSISDITSAMFGRFGVVADFGFILSTFITLASMLAGSDSIGALIFHENYNFCYISILTAMLVAVIVFVGLKYIYKITNAILPIIILLVITILGIFLAGGNAQTVSESNIHFNLPSLLLSCILYASMNTFTNIFIIAKSSAYMDKKQIGLASAISSGIIFMLIALILFSILRGGDSIFLSDMPMVSIAFSIGNFWGIAYSILLWLAIFTTICIAAYTIVEWLNRFIKSKFLCSVIVLTLGFIFSRFGFSTIVSVFYPIEGVFGAIFIVYAIVYYYKNKRRYQAEQRAVLEKLKQMESSAEFEFSEPLESELSSIEAENKNNEDKFVQNPTKSQNNQTGMNPEDICSLKVQKRNGQVTVIKKKRNGQVIKSVKSPIKK